MTSGGLSDDKTSRKNYQQLRQRLLNAKDFIDNNCCSDISLERIATEAYLSEFYFVRLFKEVFGTSPYQYYLMAKMQVAAELLKTTDQPVGAIGEKVGFKDIYSFSRSFKRIMKASPTAFREMKYV